MTQTKRSLIDTKYFKIHKSELMLSPSAFLQAPTMMMIVKAQMKLLKGECKED